ncbi:hypothetical protein BH09BAC1_BH09BAC1_10050 [soil metagenome]
MMKYRHFVKSLLKLTFALAVVLFALGFFKFFLPYIIISWVSLGFFLALTLFSGYYNSRSVKKPFFLNIFFGTMAVKFFLSAVFIFAYFMLIEPDKWVILPIIAIFFAYKASETVLLVRAFRDAEELS